MTAKKIQPQNPDTETKTTDTSPEAERKTLGFRWGGRKLARKTSLYKAGGH